MKIVVVGAAASGVGCIKNIDRHKASQIYLVEKNMPPFKKHLLLDWLVDKTIDADFFISLDRLKENNPSIVFVHDKAVRINFDRKMLFFKESQPFDFDKIILCCGTKPKKIEFTGSLKQGVHFLSAAWPPDLKRDIKIFANIIVSVKTLVGIDLVKRLAGLAGKDIKVIAENLDFLPSEYHQRFTEFLKERRIDLYAGSSIVEVLGESRAKALKLSSGKFLACDVLIIDSQVTPNIDILKDSAGVVENDPLKVDEHLRSMYDFSFVCGSMADAAVEAHNVFSDNSELIQRQARVIAKNIFGEDETFYRQEPKPKEEILESILSKD